MAKVRRVLDWVQSSHPLWQAARHFLLAKELAPEWAEADLYFGLALASVPGGRDAKEATDELINYAQRTLGRGKPWDPTLLIGLARAVSPTPAGLTPGGLSCLAIYLKHVTTNSGAKIELVTAAERNAVLEDEREGDASAGCSPPRR